MKNTKRYYEGPLARSWTPVFCRIYDAQLEVGILPQSLSRDKYLTLGSVLESDPNLSMQISKEILFQGISGTLEV